MSAASNDIREVILFSSTGFSSAASTGSNAGAGAGETFGAMALVAFAALSTGTACAAAAGTAFSIGILEVSLLEIGKSLSAGLSSRTTVFAIDEELISMPEVFDIAPGTRVSGAAADGFLTAAIAPPGLGIAECGVLLAAAGCGFFTSVSAE
jgi:hypothetical protein